MRVRKRSILSAPDDQHRQSAGAQLLIARKVALQGRVTKGRQDCALRTVDAQLSFEGFVMPMGSCTKACTRSDSTARARGALRFYGSSKRGGTSSKTTSAMRLTQANQRRGGTPLWDEEGRLVFDSGDQIERPIADRLPEDFNSTSDENNSFDDRSDDKGPEPEVVTVGEAFGTNYAFLGLERVGGIVVIDLSRPEMPAFVQYINNRNFAGDPTLGTAGDLAPEGMHWIGEQESPIQSPLLVVTNEVSGTTTLYGAQLVPESAGE